jgi:hypothetical protein
MGTPIGIKQNGAPIPTSAPVNEPSAPAQTKEPVKDKAAEQPVAEKPRSEEEVAARKAEKQFEGAAQYQKLNSQIQSVGSNSSSASLSKAKDIATDKKMTLEAKKAALQKQMENANPEEFKSLVNGSKDWSGKEQRIFSNAMGESEKIMNRVGTELNSEDQINAVIRADKYGPSGALDSKELPKSYNKIMKNVDQWMLNADGKVIDEAFSKNKEFRDRFTSHASFPGLPDMPGMSHKAKEKMVDSLTGENKQNFITDTLHPNVSNESMPTVSMLHNRMMKGMTPAEKNTTIDKLQDSGQLNDFVKHVDQLDARTVVQGLTPQNAGVVAAEYHKLAQKDAYTFDRLAGQVDGYAENNFKKNDYEEYIRMRNSYHR